LDNGGWGVVGGVGGMGGGGGASGGHNKKRGWGRLTCCGLIDMPGGR